MCFISTFTFAKTDVLSNPKTIEIAKTTTKTVSQKYKLGVRQEINYDILQFACTATYSIDIYLDGVYKTTITRSHSYFSEFSTGNCGIAMAFAQQEANDATNAYMNLNNWVELP